MNYIASLLMILVLLQSCSEETRESKHDVFDWSARRINVLPQDSLVYGNTYLSLYPEVYSFTEKTKHPLTSTVSIRNTNLEDTLYLSGVKLFNTSGDPIRIYCDHLVFVAPMETVEIIIDETDNAGGTGANFLFDWILPAESNDPIFEAVMISTSGQQGLSFTTQGVQLR